MVTGVNTATDCVINGGYVEAILVTAPRDINRRSRQAGAKIVYDGDEVFRQL